MFNEEVNQQRLQREKAVKLTDKNNQIKTSEIVEVWKKYYEEKSRKDVI